MGNSTLIKESDNALVKRSLAAINSRQRGAYLLHQDSPTVRLYGTYWDSGYRNTYYVFNTNNGRVTQLPQYAPVQFGGPKETPEHTLAECEVMVIHAFAGTKQYVRIISPWAF
jgi:hypothetical protein